MELVTKIENVIELLRSIQQEITTSRGSPVVFPEHRRSLIENRICLSCEEPILPGEKDSRKVHTRCRKEQVKSGRSDDQLVSLGMLAPEEPAGRKPLDRLEKAIAQRLQSVAKGLPAYDLSKGNPTAKEAIKAIEALEEPKDQKPRKTRKREPE